jgi:hypothetical protein
VDAAVGYAADERGNGLAYARLTDGKSRRRLLRVGFRVNARPITARATGYAAMTAVTQALCRRGFKSVRFVVSDKEFAREIATGRNVTDELQLAYVGLRCALNSLVSSRVDSGATDELTQRASAEVMLNLAA